MWQLIGSSGAGSEGKLGHLWHTVDEDPTLRARRPAGSTNRAPDGVSSRGGRDGGHRPPFIAADHGARSRAEVLKRALRRLEDS